LDAGAVRRLAIDARQAAAWKGVVAGVAQRVVAAAHELAGHGDQGDVRLEALAELAVAGVVR
jgi:hypothetical protein